MQQNRPSPSAPAKEHKGERVKGNDGNMYISIADKNGVYRWGKEAQTKPTQKTAQYTMPNTADSRLKTRQKQLIAYCNVFGKDIRSGDRSIYNQFKTQWGRGTALSTKLNDVIKQLEEQSKLSKADFKIVEKRLRTNINAYMKHGAKDQVPEFLDTLSAITAFSGEINKLMKGIPVTPMDLKRLLFESLNQFTPPKVVLSDYHIVPELFILYRMPYEIVSEEDIDDEPIFGVQQDISQDMDSALSNAKTVINRAIKNRFDVTNKKANLVLLSTK